MRHLSDGSIRRMLDEPFSISDKERSHFAGCSLCKARAERFRADQRSVAAFFQTESPRPDIAHAINRVHAAIDSKPKRSTAGRLLPSFDNPRRKAALVKVSWAGGVAAVLALSLAFTPAKNIFTIFQPKQFVPLSVTTGELRSLPNLAKFGTLTLPQNVCSRHSARGAPGSRRVKPSIHDQCNNLQFPNRAAAEAAAKMEILAPTYVPAGVPSHTAYSVMRAETSSFELDAKKAAAEMRKEHKAPVSMPAGLNGDVLRLTTGAAVLTIYGQAQAIPSLVIGQTPVPRVTSSGASITAIENYILRLPGVSKQLAAQVKAIGNPATSLPIPVPVNRAYAQRVTVNGASGIAIGDNTGVASIVIWQKAGTVYGVGGAFTQDQVLRVANSLR
jgi:hypothetical protein